MHRLPLWIAIFIEIVLILCSGELGEGAWIVIAINGVFIIYAILKKIYEKSDNFKYNRNLNRHIKKIKEIGSNPLQIAEYIASIDSFYHRLDITYRFKHIDLELLEIILDGYSIEQKTKFIHTLGFMAADSLKDRYGDIGHIEKIINVTSEYKKKVLFKSDNNKD